MKKASAGRLPVSIPRPPRPYTGHIFPANPTKFQPIAPPPLYEAAACRALKYIHYKSGTMKKPKEPHTT